MKKYIGTILLLVTATFANNAFADNTRYFKIINDDLNPTGVIKLYSEVSTKADLMDWGGIGIMKAGYDATLTSDGTIDIAYDPEGCHVFLVPTSTPKTYNYCFCATEDTEEWPACRGRLAIEQ